MKLVVKNNYLYEKILKKYFFNCLFFTSDHCAVSKMTVFVDENSTSAKDAVNPNLSEKSGFTAFFAEVSCARTRARKLGFFRQKTL